MFRYPILKPSPIAIMKTIAATPHEMPNIVSALRSLCAQRLAKLWVMISQAMAKGLRQHQLVRLLNPFKHLRALPVGNAETHRNLSPALVFGSIAQLHGSVPVPVVNQSGFGDEQDVLAFFKHDLSI